MAADVIPFPSATYAGRPDLLLADVLQAAKDGAISEVIVIGIKPDGTIDPSSTMGDADTNWYLDQCKHQLVAP